MTAYVARLILSLAPHLGEALAGLYASDIAQAAARHGVDPVLMVALASRESGFDDTASSRGNWGMFQVRVSPTTNAEYIGHEQALWNSALNAEIAAKSLSYWRYFHVKHCQKAGPTKRVHDWWAHYQHGKRVRDGGASGRRVGAVWRALVGGRELSR